MSQETAPAEISPLEVSFDDMQRAHDGQAISDSCDDNRQIALDG